MHRIGPFLWLTQQQKIRVAAQMLYYKQISVRFKHAQSVVAHTHTYTLVNRKQTRTVE